MGKVESKEVEDKKIMKSKLEKLKAKDVRKIIEKKDM